MSLREKEKPWRVTRRALPMWLYLLLLQLL